MPLHIDVTVGDSFTDLSFKKGIAVKRINAKEI